MSSTIHKEDSVEREEAATKVSPLPPKKSSFAPITDETVDAWLSLTFKSYDGITRLMERGHFGQLIIQKPFYLDRENHGVCHVIIVHPPGGVCGGDELRFSSDVGAAGKVQVTTPGATKWYKANGNISRQEVKLNVETGATLEWLPQEAIFFDGAHVQLSNEITLAKDATFIGCEILCFGRTRSGENFDSGQLTQRTRIHRDGKPIWFEQLQLKGGGSAMKSPLMLAGYTVCATLVVVSGEAVSSELIDSMREEASEIADGVGELGVTQLKSVVVVRYLGDSSEVARRIMLQVWGILRPTLVGHEASVPRMWTT